MPVIHSRAYKIKQHWAQRSHYADRWFAMIGEKPAFGWTVGLFLLALSLMPKFMHGLNADSLIYLYLAGRLLDGEHYYTDFFEYNTPFAIGIYALPVAAARLLGISTAIAAKVFVTLLIPATIALVHCIACKSREYSSVARYNALIITLFFALSYPSNFYFNELATKSIIYLTFILPYMFCVQLQLEKRSLPRWLDATASVLLGLALCLKPHYALFPTVMEIYLALKLQRFSLLWRWQNLLAGVIAAVYYMAVIPLFFPGYIKLIPFFFIYYGPVQRSFYDKLTGLRLTNLLHTLLYLSPLLLWLWSMKRQLPRLPSYHVMMAALGASILILNTEALFTEDQLTILVFFICLPFLYSLLTVLRQLHTVRQHIDTKRRFFATFAVIFATVSIFGLVNIISAFNPEPNANEKTEQSMQAYIDRYAPESPVYAISEHTIILKMMRPPYPAFHTPQMLYNLQWQINADPHHISPEVQKAQQYFIQSILSYFAHTRPKLVFVNRMDWAFQMRFLRGAYYCFPGLLEILLNAYPEFRTLWEQHYVKIGTILQPVTPRWLEDRQPRTKNVEFDDKTYRVTLPPESPIANWLDVYIRKD